MKDRERQMQWNRLQELGETTLFMDIIARDRWASPEQRRVAAVEARRYRQDAQTTLRVIAMMFGHEAAVELREAFREGVTL